MWFPVNTVTPNKSSCRRVKNNCSVRKVNFDRQHQGKNVQEGHLDGSNTCPARMYWFWCSCSMPDVVVVVSHMLYKYNTTTTTTTVTGVGIHASFQL